ncbi:FAD:protein FMN transferase [bacterium]|nr:FAD:protein FMN transferase [bacterium]
MKQKRILMGMTISVEIVDAHVTEAAFDAVYSYFKYVDETFSVFKETSEITKINKGLISAADYSPDMREVFRLSEETKQATNGYFDIMTPDGKCNPSGLVKGWAILNASKILKTLGFKNFCIDAGGDIQVAGRNASGAVWTVGIRSPFNPEKEIVKVLSIEDRGVATSGTYIRGRHIYDPHAKSPAPDAIISLTVIGPDVYEADRYATAAFAMGAEGINFIEGLEGFEGYMIDGQGVATMTSGFDGFVKKDA